MVGVRDEEYRFRRLAEYVAKELVRLNASGEEWAPAEDVEALLAKHRAHPGRVVVNQPADTMVLECDGRGCYDEETDRGTVDVVAQKVRKACCDGHRTGLRHSDDCTAPPSGRQRSGHYLAHHSGACPTCNGIADQLLAASTARLRGVLEDEEIEAMAEKLGAARSLPR